MGKRAPKGTPTALNISTLADFFGTETERPNRVDSVSAAGMRRCAAAGLVAVSGTRFLVLTPSGIAAVAELRARRAARGVS